MTDKTNHLGRLFPRKIETLGEFTDLLIYEGADLVTVTYFAPSFDRHYGPEEKIRTITAPFHLDSRHRARNLVWVMDYKKTYNTINSSDHIEGIKFVHEREIAIGDVLRDIKCKIPTLDFGIRLSSGEVHSCYDEIQSYSEHVKNQLERINSTSHEPLATNQQPLTQPLQPSYAE